ncbi:ABC transporter substrate-binding protein [Alkalihalobacillus trypoxylicola]|uniref:Lactose ABC transporter substrate-binding protein n=1 Tax=Alkalihalobacillus trypoxylicola TaxID=519424 RepID=A0A162CTH3_9BACI|nr:extracellular solute-binding protein [Alkalihalobacillus trypoxylicola]KYG26586.1 lactose ABC transporter substrate-binding protein [Alkalihalobacillus trypoxylicola]
MQKKKWNILLSSMLMLIFILVGCSTNNNEDSSSNGNEESEGGSSDQVTLRVAWWGGQERHDMTLEAIDLFEEEYPHIKVDPEFTAWDGYWERLNTQAAGTNLPDVINMDNSKLNEYNSRDLLKDLSSLIEDGSINLENVDDVYQEINEVDGEVLAVSLGANSLSVITNETVLSDHGISLEPGYTYEDLMEAMLQIKEAEEAEGNEFFGFDFANAEFELFFSYARQAGESVFNEDGTELGFSETTLVDFFSLVQQLVNEGAAPPHDVTMEYVDGGDSMVGTGEAAVSMAASNQIIGVAQQTEDELGLNLLPALEGGIDGNWIRPSMSFSISAHSEKEEAAALFIDFFTNSLEANEILMADRGVPISSEVRNHLSDKVEGPIKETFDFLELVADYTSPADPLSPPGETEVRGSFLRIIEMLKYDRISPEEAAEQFMNEASSVLN